MTPLIPLCPLGCPVSLSPLELENYLQTQGPIPWSLIGTTWWSLPFCLQITCEQKERGLEHSSSKPSHHMGWFVCRRSPPTRSCLSYISLFYGVSAAVNFNPVASFVSALNLHKKHPPMLLKALPTPILIRKSGYKAITKRNAASNPSIPTARSLLASTVPLAKRAPLMLFLPCVFWQLKEIRICFLIVQNLALLSLVIRKTGYG